MQNILKGRLIFVRIILIAAMLVLIAIGVAAIYSVGHPSQPSTAKNIEDLSHFWKKQLIFAVIGIIAFFAVNTVNYRRFGAVSYWLYAFVIALLGIVLLGKFFDIPFVPLINNTHRWIRFSIMGYTLPSVQPSELCKLAYIIALAWYLRYRSNYRKFNALIGPFILTLLPMVLILLEPDLGTVMLMMPVLFTMLFVAGAKGKHLLRIILLTIVVSPLFWYFMENYQKERISSVLLQYKWVSQKAEQHPAFANILGWKSFSSRQWTKNEGFQLIRSKYAIASGGMTGYGFRKGPFIKYDFLPYRHNDFIFATIAHQWGFLGSITLLALYAIIVICGLEIAMHNTDPFGKLLAIGIVAMFAVEAIVNISMTLGLMPITGLTLPFISYGGSNLVVSMASVGLLNNVGRCRPYHHRKKIK